MHSGAAAGPCPRGGTLVVGLQLGGALQEGSRVRGGQQHGHELRQRPRGRAPACIEQCAHQPMPAQCTQNAQAAHSPPLASWYRPSRSCVWPCDAPLVQHRHLVCEARAAPTLRLALRSSCLQKSAAEPAWAQSAHWQASDVLLSNQQTPTGEGGRPAGSCTAACWAGNSSKLWAARMPLLTRLSRKAIGYVLIAPDQALRGPASHSISSAGRLAAASGSRSRTAACQACLRSRARAISRGWRQV